MYCTILKLLGVEITGRKRRSAVPGAIGAGARSLLYGTIDDITSKQKAYSKTLRTNVDTDNLLFQSDQRQVQSD